MALCAQIATTFGSTGFGRNWSRDWEVFFMFPLLTVDFFFSRLLGLIGFVETKCDNPQALDYRSEDLDWPHFVFVAVVVTLYWFLATEIRYDNNDQV